MLANLETALDLFSYPRHLRRYDNARRATVTESPEAFTAVLEVPGYTESGLKVTLSDKVLSISGRRSDDSFERFWTLPTKVTTEGTTAELQDGILTVRVEKAAEAQPTQIPIRRMV